MRRSAATDAVLPETNEVQFAAAIVVVAAVIFIGLLVWLACRYVARRRCGED